MWRTHQPPARRLITTSLIRISDHQVPDGHVNMEYGGERSMNPDWGDGDWPVISAGDFFRPGPRLGGGAPGGGWWCPPGGGVPAGGWWWSPPGGWWWWWCPAGWWPKFHGAELMTILLVVRGGCLSHTTRKIS